MSLNVSTQYISDVAERAVKTFLQFFFANWFLLSHAAVGYDTLFTWGNVKAGIVGLALSIATSIGSKPFANKDTASLVEK